MIKRLFIALIFVSLFSFISFAEQVSVVIDDEYHADPPPGVAAGEEYDITHHYGSNRPDTLFVDGTYNFLSLSDLTYYTSKSYVYWGSSTKPYRIRNYLVTDLPDVISWLPSNPHQYTYTGFGFTLQYTSLANVTDMLELTADGLLLSPGQHYLLSFVLRNVSSVSSFGLIDYPSSLNVIQSTVYTGTISGQARYVCLVEFEVSEPVLMDNMPFRTVFSTTSDPQVYVDSFSVGAYQSSDDVVDAIRDQTEDMHEQWDKEDQAMAGGVNPGQSGVNDSISQGITDLDDFDNQIFADFDEYKSDLDFGLSAWGEAAAGISYIGNIFMIIWDNSPNQVIVLSLMLGLCCLVLGRGAKLARAARRSDRGADDG